MGLADNQTATHTVVGVLGYNFLVLKQDFKAVFDSRVRVFKEEASLVGRVGLL